MEFHDGPYAILGPGITTIRNQVRYPQIAEALKPEDPKLRNALVGRSLEETRYRTFTVPSRFQDHENFGNWGHGGLGFRSLGHKRIGRRSL